MVGLSATVRLLGEVVPGGGETAIGGGVFALLCVVAVQLLRRTKEVDSTRDQLAALAMRLAEERERQAFAERDAARARADQLTLEIETLLRERNGHDGA